MTLLNMRPHAGWLGVFTRDQAPGAIPNGTAIQKVKTETGDAHPIGAKGIVLGSLRHESIPGIGYFVEWDRHPRAAVFVIDWKIGPV